MSDSRGSGVIFRALGHFLSVRIMAERARWALWLPVGIGLGIAFYFALGEEPAFFWGPLALFALILMGWVFRDRTEVLILTLVLGSIVLGFSAAGVRTQSVFAPVLDGRIGPTTIEGRVSDVETFPKRLRIRLENLRIRGLGLEQTPGAIRLSLRGKQPTLHPGDWVRVPAIVAPSSGPVQPGAFDFARHAFFQGLGGNGFSVGLAQVVRRADAPGAVSGPAGFWLWVADVRLGIVTHIQAAFDGKKGARAGVAAALMTGERRAVPEDVLQAIRDSGLAHLLAISGLHVGLVAGILFFSVRAVLALIPGIALRYPIKKWAAGVALLGALAFGILAGATVPTQRAVLMIGLVLFAVMVDRRGLSMRSVAFVATAILLFRPESLLGASFQLSFAAVVALIAVYESYSARERRTPSPKRTPARQVGHYLFGVALTTLIAGAATAPFAAYHFNRVADFGLVANLVAVSVTALWVMPAAVLAFVLMPFGWEAPALHLMGAGIDVVVATARWVAAWPGAVTRLPAADMGALVLVSAGGLWLCFWLGRWRYWGIGGIVAGVVLLVTATPPDVLVSDDGRLMAVKSETGKMAFSSLARGRFQQAIWLRRQGADEGGALNFQTAGTAGGRGAVPDLRCDGLGCIYEKAGVRVALVSKGLALGEDCERVEVVIARVPVRTRCGADVVIDRFDLWRKGAHALWIDEEGRVTVKNVAEEQGSRPWSRQRKTKKRDSLGKKKKSGF